MGVGGGRTGRELRGMVIRSYGGRGPSLFPSVRGLTRQEGYPDRAGPPGTPPHPRGAAVPHSWLPQAPIRPAAVMLRRFPLIQRRAGPPSQHLEPAFEPRHAIGSRLREPAAPRPICHVIYDLRPPTPP